MHLLATLHAHYVARRHSALLAAIVIAFAARPLVGDAGVGPLVFSLTLMVVMLVSLYTMQVEEMLGERKTLLRQRRRRGTIGAVLAVLAIGERIAAIVAPSELLLRVGSICWLLFFAFVTWAELRSVLKHRAVTTETLSMSVSVYLLIGLTWGLLYSVIAQYQPAAFNFGTSATGAAPLPPGQLFPIFIYFSLTTLATIGFGDITPLTLQARYAAVAEGITGQLYLAILVARLVGMHMSAAPNADTRA